MSEKDGEPGVSAPRAKTLGRLFLLLGAAVVLSGAVNALSPRGISWTDPLGPGLRGRLALAGLETVPLGAVVDGLRSGSLVFVDARPRDEFEVGHLPDATSFPWHDLEEGMPSPPLPPRDRPLVIYCGNEFCEAALRLGEWLRARGYRKIGVFLEGYEAWWNAGGRREAP
jgi:rhodanese-related sulfurtransferase